MTTWSFAFNLKELPISVWGYCVLALIFNPNCGFTPTFLHFAFYTLHFYLYYSKLSLILPLLHEQHITVSNMTIVPLRMYPYFYLELCEYTLIGVAIIFQQHINQNMNKNDKILILSCALCLRLNRIHKLLRLLDDAIKHFPLHNSWFFFEMTTNEISCAFIRLIYRYEITCFIHNNTKQ
jgi:hypothetical protein